MPNYLIAYHGMPAFDTPEAAAEGRTRFMAWVGGLGEAIVNPGTPLMSPRILRPGGAIDEAGPESMTGFSVVAADNLEAAVAIARSCPYLDQCPVQVAEMMEMRPG